MSKSAVNEFEHEIAYVLIGERIENVWHAKMRWPSAGGRASVDFDWRRVLEREEKYGDVVGFYHTHPGKMIMPSGRDERTMRSWCSCFGRSLLCVIATSDNVVSWLFEPDAEEARRLHQTLIFPRKWLVASDLVGSEILEGSYRK
ncbi:MAG TPA: Mov34/MPN/PAD-1 family protein [Candidatus Obscuribacterales bacterium]